MKKVIIICGPSASGKNTIIERLFKDGHYSFNRVITNTTRPKRPTDKDGEIYHFLSKIDFEKKLQAGYFYESENVHGNFYGTAKNSFNKDGVYLMQCDIRGANNLKQLINDCLIIFVNVPEEQMLNRLKERGSTDKEIIARLKTAEQELKMIKSADVVIDNLNGHFDETLSKVKSAIDNFLKVG